MGEKRGDGGRRERIIDLKLMWRGREHNTFIGKSAAGVTENGERGIKEGEDTL